MQLSTPLPVRKRRLVSYLAGPYRDPRGVYYITRNIQEARDVSAVLWQMGFASVCPHMNTYLLDGLEGTEDGTFLEGDLDMIERCDLLVAMPRYIESRGTLAEIAHAKACGLPVYYWETDQVRLAGMAAVQLSRPAGDMPTASHRAPTRPYRSPPLVAPSYYCDGNLGGVSPSELDSPEA